MRHVILVLAGMIAGIAIVISCSDGSPPAVDAAVEHPPADATKCECPPAEPPIAGRIVTASNVREAAPNDHTSQGAVCPAGSMLLTASCTAANRMLYNLTLRQSGLGDLPNSWFCSFFNHEAIPVVIKVEVVCLRAAP